MMLPPPWLVMTLLLTPKSDTCEEISFTFWWPVMFWAFCKSNFRTIFLIYFENNVCYPMFYGPVVELTIVFGYEIICFCSCLANACDVFPLLLGLSLSLFFFFFFSALFEGFCQVFAFVGNVHPSRRDLITWPSYLTYTLFKGFCQVFALISNIHPSRQNLVTWHFYLTYTPFEGFCQVFGLVSNVPPLRRNLVTMHFYLTYTLFKGFCQVFGLVSNVHLSRRNLVTWHFYLTYTLFEGFLSSVWPCQ